MQIREAPDVDRGARRTNLLGRARPVPVGDAPTASPLPSDSRYVRGPLRSRPTPPPGGPPLSSLSQRQAATPTISEAGGRGGRVELARQPRRNKSPNGGRGLVYVLDEDRSLCAGLTDEELGAARRHAVAVVAKLARGNHRPAELFSGQGLVGLLVLDGLIVHQVTVADHRSGELLGPGVILRPWDDPGGTAPVPFEVDWRVIADARVAVLDHRFLLTITHWPALIDALVERLSDRAQTLALNAAIQSLPQVNLRLLVLLWHLADRFGRVTPDGIHLPLPLCHSDLAELVGAARPTVSIALRKLAETGQVWRREDRTWMLSKDPPAALCGMPRQEQELSDACPSTAR